MKLKERTIAGTFLNKLPAELLGIIATHTDNKELKAMRATCRELRDASSSEFFRRHTSIYIHLEGGEHFDLLHLKLAIKTPDVVMAQAMTQSLIVPNPWNSFTVSERNTKPLRDRIPEHAAKIYTDPPASISDFEIVQSSIVNPYKGSAAAPILLKRSTALVAQTLHFRRLVLADLDTDGDYVIKLSEMYLACEWQALLSCRE